MRRSATKRAISRSRIFGSGIRRSDEGCTVAITIGAGFKVSEQRGVAVASPLAPIVIATVHPSSLLRMPDPKMRERETARFVADLRTLRELAGRR